MVLQRPPAGLEKVRKIQKDTILENIEKKSKSSDTALCLVAAWGKRLECQKKLEIELHPSG